MASLFNHQTLSLKVCFGLVWFVPPLRSDGFGFGCFLFWFGLFGLPRCILFGLALLGLEKARGGPVVSVGGGQLLRPLNEVRLLDTATW